MMDVYYIDNNINNKLYGDTGVFVYENTDNKADSLYYVDRLQCA